MNETAHVLDLVGFVVGIVAVMGIIVLAGRLWTGSGKSGAGAITPPDTAPPDTAPPDTAPPRTTPSDVAPSPTGPAGGIHAGPPPADLRPPESSRSEEAQSRPEVASPSLALVGNGSALAVATNGAEAPSAPATSNGKHPMTNGIDRTAGWRPDPEQGEDLLRYWDGLRWTDHFARRVTS